MRVARTGRGLICLQEEQRGAGLGTEGPLMGVTWTQGRCWNDGSERCMTCEEELWKTEPSECNGR